MNVYIAKRTETNSGGILLVAANSPEEATQVIYEHPDGEFYHIMYDIFNWEKSEILTANVYKPQLIDESGYTKI